MDLRAAATRYEVGQVLAVRTDGSRFGVVTGHDPSHVFRWSTEVTPAYLVRDETGVEQWVSEWFAERALEVKG